MITGTLENWTIINRKGKEVRLCGEVYGNKDNTFHEGEFIKTDFVPKLSLRRGTRVRDFNRMYKLGRPCPF